MTSATALDGRVRLSVADTRGGHRDVTRIHVIAATGYRINLERLGFLPDVMLSSLRRTVGGSAAVGRDYQSSIPGLYFIGPSVALSMGPVMRFVFGAEHAATTVGRHLAAAPGRRRLPGDVMTARGPAGEPAATAVRHPSG